MACQIRKYRGSDRKPVRRICADTAVLGKPVDVLFDDREIAADMLISYHIDYEPESCFVAVSGGRVVGYLAGCVDLSRRRRETLLKIIPSVLAKAIRRKTLFRRKNLLTCGGFAASFFNGEFSPPSFSGDYPANMHINVERAFRGRGVGAGLLREYFKYLKGRNIKGVMLDTKSEDAAGFFLRHGFKVLFSGRISCLSHCGFPQARLYVLGKKDF